MFITCTYFSSRRCFLKIYTLSNKTRDTIIGSKIYRADSFISKLVGLLGKKNLDEGEGLLIGGCSSVHMMGMKIPLDLIFLNKENKVLKIVEAAQPNKLSFSCKGAKKVVELWVGSSSHVSVGDSLTLSEPNFIEK